MVGPRVPSRTNGTTGRLRGLQAPTGGHKHSRSGNGSRERPPNASLHHAASISAPATNSPIPVARGRLHPPICQSTCMEMVRPTRDTDDMDQGVPLYNMPRSDIPPPARAVRSHHIQPQESPDTDGAAHPCRDSRTTTDVTHSEPTVGPGRARQEKIPGRKVGPTSPFPVQTCLRTGA